MNRNTFESAKEAKKKELETSTLKTFEVYCRQDYYTLFEVKAINKEQAKELVERGEGDEVSDGQYENFEVKEVTETTN